MNGSLNSDAPVAAPLSSHTRPLYWSVRRELWENRSVWIAPIVVTAFVMFGTFISIVTAAHRHSSIVPSLSMAPAPIMLATFIIAFFYSLEALHGERRDRSILFWKSLPVSDAMTILSKAAIPFAVLPLIALALSFITQWALLMIGTLVFAGSGNNPAIIWSEFHFIQSPFIMIYGLLVHVLWFAPIYGWLLLISAWARRTPVLWAVLPVFAISVLERITFGTTYFAKLLGWRFKGAMETAFVPGTHGRIDSLTELDPGRFLTTSGLWLGLLFAAACLITAARLRRNREPI
jgi:ABC-2 type transport system permease protein